MQKLIIVGGPSRTGTNSISTYLHLNDQIAMFHSGPPIKDLLDLSEWTRQTEFLQKVFGPPDNRPSECFDEYIGRKNQSFIKGTFGVSYIGRRYDHAEFYDHIIERLVRKFEVKFVYCMREDVGSLFISQTRYGFAWSEEHFVGMITRSMDIARQLKAKGISMCAIDVTVSNRDLKRLDEFLGLPPSLLQLKWYEENPVTNQVPDWKKGPDVKYNPNAFRSLKKLYNLTRTELNGK